MKVGDLVQVRNRFSSMFELEGCGVVLDSFEDDDGLTHLEVCWGDRREWFSPLELELVSES